MKWQKEDDEMLTKMRSESDRRNEARGSQLGEELLIK
jgi:hypothetical protein